MVRKRGRRMKLLKLKQDSNDDLFEKVMEEANELADAVMTCENKDRVLSECMDVIQATFSFMQEVATKDELIEAGKEHVRKLRSRGHDVEKIYKIMEVQDDNN